MDQKGKKHGKPAPQPGGQAQRLCGMGKSNRAGLLFYFFASRFLLTTLTFGSEVSWQRRGLHGTLFPALPGSAGSAPGTERVAACPWD